MDSNYGGLLSPTKIYPLEYLTHQILWPRKFLRLRYSLWEDLVRLICPILRGEFLYFLQDYKKFTMVFFPIYLVRLIFALLQTYKKIYDDFFQFMLHDQPISPQFLTQRQAIWIWSPQFSPFMYKVFASSHTFIQYTVIQKIFVVKKFSLLSKSTKIKHTKYF